MFSIRSRYGARGVLVLCLLLMLTVMPVAAHVKWFTDFSFLDQPESLGDALSPLVLALTAAAMLTMAILVFVDRRLEHLRPYIQIRDWLESHKDMSTLVLRIGMGATFLLSWQDESLLAPYLQTNAPLGWIQFLLVMLLLFPATTPIAGFGTILLWFVGTFDFGVFYMLDYLAFLGIGYWLLVSTTKNAIWREARIPALYFTVGFSLIWLAMEKLVYPQWSMDILEANPQLTLGLPPEFFATSAAFVEITLGYLLIIGLLGRPLGLVITLVFFTTTLVFGKVEVIGHTHLHAALVVFLLNGPGNLYPAPINIHHKMNRRMAFAAVNFALIFAVFISVYSFGAHSTYEHALDEAITPEVVQRCRDKDDGTVELHEIIIETETTKISCDVVLEHGA